METGLFKGYDRAEISFCSWNYKPFQKTIIFVHSENFYSGRIQEFASYWCFADYNIFAFDMRGHGQTKAEMTPHFMDMVRDLDAFARFLAVEYRVKQKDIFVVGNGLGAVVATAWAHDFSPKIAGMALLTPAFEYRSVCKLSKVWLKLVTKFKPDYLVKNLPKATDFTSVTAQQIAYNNDANIRQQTNARFLLDALNTANRLVKDAPTIHIPTLILSAEKDKVVKNSTQKRFFANLGSELKKFVTMNNFLHGVLFEQERALIYDYLNDFIVKAYRHNLRIPSLRQDKFTVSEHLNMRFGFIPLCEKYYYALCRSLLKFTANFSRGLRIGFKKGFESADSFAYICKNQPSGSSALHRFIDNKYLQLPENQLLRVRDKNLVNQLERAIKLLKQEGKRIQILDISGGIGGYLFEVISKYPEISVLINEKNTKMLEKCKNLVEEFGFSQVKFVSYDHFDENSYKELDFNPNITIVSGIFEQYTDNELINEALKGITTISLHGFIIYTGNPWRRNLLQKALVFSKDKPKEIIIRRRSQKELDTILNYNGVKKQRMLIDNEGVFTVSLGKINQFL